MKIINIIKAILSWLANLWQRNPATGTATDSNVINFDQGVDVATDKYKELVERLDRDYEGGTVLVEWASLWHKNGKQDLRMVESVKNLFGQNADLLFTLPHGYGVEVYTQESIRMFGRTFPFIHSYPDKVVEVWSKKAIQFTNQGYRIDGANKDSVGLFITICKDKKGIDIDTRPPRITTADEQVASLGMYLYRCVINGVNALTKGGKDRVEIPKSQVKDSPDGK